MKERNDKNNMNFEITPEDKQLIFDTVAIIKKVMKPKLSLTPKERRNITALGVKREEFVKEIIAIVEKNPYICPEIFNTDDLKKWYNITKDFSEILNEINILQKQILNFYLIAGSKTYKKAMLIKQFLKHLNSVDTLYNEQYLRLNKYFKRKKETNE
ncbi:MAG: hypothetical protein HY738_11035 [Bacteroidia bacterium]|nr:hypothetical protein [Bacteroidia bacterium]